MRAKWILIKDAETFETFGIRQMAQNSWYCSTYVCSLQFINAFML
jgi:hypothetical protein